MNSIEKDSYFCSKVSQLRQEVNRDAIEHILLEILDYVITHYALKFPNGTLRLLELEIYYRGANYAGESTHGDELQTNRCGKLYDHRKGGTRKGFDVVLSQGKDYYLSCLVKGTVCEDEVLFKQGMSYDKCQAFAGVDNLSEYKPIALAPLDKPTIGPVLHSKRIGLTNESDKDAILRSLNCSYLEPQSKDFNLLYKYKGYQKTEFFKAEMKLRRVNPQQATDLSKLLLGYVEKASIAEFFNQAGSQD